MPLHLIGGRRIDTAERGRAVRSDGEGAGSAFGVPHHVVGGDGAAPGVGCDPTLDALEALGHALEEMTKDQELLQERLRALQRQREEGRLWRDIVSEGDAPGTMLVVSRMLVCLAKASGELRKELVDNLRREGVSISTIARLFGVTHQRVSNLLRRPPSN